MKKVLLVVAALATAAWFATSAGASPRLFFGFAEDAPKWEGSRAVNPMVDIGAKSFRITAGWTPGQTTVSYKTATEISRALTSAPGMRVIVSVFSTGANTPLTDTARTQFCTYARNVAARSSRLNDIVIGNEPNLSYFWRPQFNADGTSASPAAYYALLSRCYDVLHAYRSTINVVAPATSPSGNDAPNATSNISHSPNNFIRQLGLAYRASGRQAPIFDTVAHHVYGATPVERPWKQHTSGKRISQGDWGLLMQAYSEAFGGTAQPIPGECVSYRCVEIWYLENGWQTVVDAAKTSEYTYAENVVTLPDYAGGEPLSPAPSADSRAPDQVTQFSDALRLAYCQPYVGAMFNFLLTDERDLRRWQSGILWADWTAKDSYAYFKQSVRELNQRAVDCAALKGGPATTTPDVTPPAAPMGLTGKRNWWTRKIALDWADSSERDVTGFNVYRSTDYGFSYTKRNTTLVTASTFTDAGTYGSAYYYVTAVDTSDNESARSNVAIVR